MARNVFVHPAALGKRCTLLKRFKSGPGPSIGHSIAASGDRAAIPTFRRQYLSGRDDTRPTLLFPAHPCYANYQSPIQPVSVWLGNPSRRRRNGGARPQRGARGTARYPETTPDRETQFVAQRSVITSVNARARVGLRMQGDLRLAGAERPHQLRGLPGARTGGGLGRRRHRARDRARLLGCRHLRELGWSTGPPAAPTKPRSHSLVYYA
jgi:hypothetical protein